MGLEEQESGGWSCYNVTIEWHSNHYGAASEKYIDLSKLIKAKIIRRKIEGY